MLPLKHLMYYASAEVHLLEQHPHFEKSFLVLRRIPSSAVRWFGSHFADSNSYATSYKKWVGLEAFEMQRCGHALDGARFYRQFEPLARCAGWSQIRHVHFRQCGRARAANLSSDTSFCTWAQPECRSNCGSGYGEKNVSRWTKVLLALLKMNF